MSNHAAPNYVPLGPGPRPTHGEDLLARVRAAAHEEGITALHASVADAFFAGTAVQLDGDDITSLAVDATGIVIPEEAFGPDAEPSYGSTLPPVVASTPGMLRLATFRAHPITVAGVRADVDVEIRDLPLRWVETSDGGSGVEPLEPSASQPVTGHLRLSAPQAALLDAVRRIATTTLAAEGVTLTRLDIALTSTGPRQVRVVADAKLRKGILSASAQASGAASLDDAMVLRFSDVSLGSANPIVAGLLAMARGRVQEATREPIDLAAQLPAGVRVADVRLDVGTDLVVSARLV